jgi:NADPH-dependent F420 reductase
MRVAIIGGTGKLGSSLAIAFANSNEVIIGSREKEKAVTKANELSDVFGINLKGMSNSDACAESEVIIVSVPYSGMDSILSNIEENVKGKVVISSVVPFVKRNGYFFYSSSTSAAEELASKLSHARVCSAFHTVPYSLLARKRIGIKMDVPVASDSKGTYEVVSRLILSADGMRPLYSGPLFVSRYIEGTTVLLLNIAIHNSLRNPFIKIITDKESLGLNEESDS